MNIKLKKIGLVIGAGILAFILYTAWLVVISFLHDYFDGRSMLEAKLFSGSFLRPIGLVLIAAWLMLAGIFLRYAKGKKVGVYILIVYFAASVIPYGLSFLATPPTSTSSSAEKKSVEPEVFVSTSVQSSEGITQEDMNVKFLSNYSDFAKKSVIRGLRQHLESHNKYLPDDFNMYSESMYIHSDGKKLAVVRFTISGSASSVEILGINRDKMHRVSCKHQSGKEIPLLQGKCADRISEIFKVNLEKGVEVEHL